MPGRLLHQVYNSRPDPCSQRESSYRHIKCVLRGRLCSEAFVSAQKENMELLEFTVYFKSSKLCYLSNISQFLLTVLTTRYFCLFKCSLCQIRWLKSHKFLPCRGQETWQTTSCSPINHRLQFMTCVTSPARKRSPLTTTADKPSLEVNKKSNMLVFLSWGILDVVSAVILYETIDCCARCSLIVSEPFQHPTSSQLGFYRDDIVCLTSALDDFVNVSEGLLLFVRRQFYLCLGFFF